MISVPVTVVGLLLSRMVQLRSTIHYNIGQVITASISVVGFAIVFYLLKGIILAALMGFIIGQISVLAVYLVIALRDKILEFSIDFSTIKLLFLSGSTMQLGLVAIYLGT